MDQLGVITNHLIAIQQYKLAISNGTFKGSDASTIGYLLKYLDEVEKQLTTQKESLRYEENSVE